MNSTVTIRDYLETIRAAEEDIFDAISIKTDSDPALRYQLLYRAVRQIGDARYGIAAIESDRRINAMIGGLRGSRNRDRDARGRFLSCADTEQAEWDRWMSEREAEREARLKGLDIW